MKKLFLDRRDGKRIKHKDPVLRLIPYIMPKRYDAHVYFEDSVNLTDAEKLIKSLRKEGHRIIFLHVVMAAMLRTMVDYPKTNRFVKGRKVYARNDLCFSFAVKKEMSLQGEETVLKIYFDRKDTLIDIINKTNEAILKSKTKNEKNQTDKLAKLFNFLPGSLLRFAIFLVNRMDNHRLLPKFLSKASPFHSSAFVTDLGSLGISPIYHHIYDFGTTSFFFAFGTKKRNVILDKDHNIKAQRQMDIKIAIDERISDGYYMATVIKRFKKYIEKPEGLLNPPEVIPVDDEIR
ncbi:MAG: 2-oxo acid dehydrogenase subunit E2 [Candidatus Izemoplasmataceae bacterium]|jgi:hypothetical protein|uniref:2-oxo acid dehydrogenase subunit E2 n=1 Tax=Liberiplasma polymorphum TaxID=3374570 RepID=UPI003771D9A9